MLGDQIGEETGKVVVIRVLDSSPLKAEVSIHTKGKLLGNDYQGRATYTSAMQGGGFLYGEGHGTYLTPGGDMVTWIGQGTGSSSPGEGQAIVARFISATLPESWRNWLGRWASSSTRLTRTTTQRRRSGSGSSGQKLEYAKTPRIID
jgi:hypothetical protein